MLAQHKRQNIKRYATEVVKATSLYWYKYMAKKIANLKVDLT